jgi:hypothetical protein
LSESDVRTLNVLHVLRAASVKSFGYRPMTTVAPGAGPVFESLQGKNPRDVEKGARRKVYGDLKFAMRAAGCASIECGGR